MRLLFLCLLVVANVHFGFAQSFGERLTLQVGTAVHAANDQNEPGGLSLAFHPYYELTDHWSIGLRYDAHLVQFGERGRFFSGESSYWTRESHLRNHLSFTLIPQYKTTLFDAPALFGLGIGYFMRSEVIEKRFLFPGETLNEIQERNATGAFGVSYTSSIVFNKIQTGIIINMASDQKIYNQSHILASIFINYQLFKNRIFKEIKNVNYKNPKSDKLPFVTIGFGIQPMGNLGNYASVFNYYLEPQILATKRLAIGFRVNATNPIRVGYDKHPIAYLERDPLQRFWEPTWNNVNELSNTYARLLTSYYYFKNDYGWYFINSGFGFYQKKGSAQIDAYNFDYEFDPIPAVPAKKNIGGFVGAGFKIGAFRVSLEYNFTGKNIPDYLAAQLSAEFGINKN